MVQTALTDPEVANLRAVRERFFKINQRRIASTLSSLPQRQRDILNLVPLLFHTNNTGLPGYVSDVTPAGVSQYSPTSETIKAAQRNFPGFELERRARHHMDIHALFSMGSSGSIAYNSSSDFDFWLIHSSGISPRMLEQLAEKARRIEAWASGMRLEVHFFIFNDAGFKQGQHDNLSSESSGSAQHFLLLDEFYRSSLLIAGRYPLWWLIPPEQEQQYEQYREELLRRGLLDNDEFVDFGHVAKIPPDEFFGAAVWQLYKGIDSPFKSVLKLLLMEVYASEHPGIDLLSIIFKRAVYQEITDVTSLDPYIMLYRKIEEYLMVKLERERLELFRKCFYFKINLKIGQQVKSEYSNWRRDVMRDLVIEWGWDDNKLRLLDRKDQWKIDNVIEERRSLIKAFTTSYHFLSDFAKKHAEVSRVTQSELHILGRKLYAAFERKAGKVEIINRGIAPDSLEPELTICQVRNKDGQDKWLLYRGNTPVEEIGKDQPLKMARSAIELLAWSYFNHIIGSKTAISAISYQSSLSAKDIKDILGAFEQLFPEGNIPKPHFNDLNQPAYANTAGLFINIGIRHLQVKDGMERHVSSDRIDALSYGGYHENLAKTFDLIVTTSWEEILIYRYQGTEGLLQCLTDYSRFSPLRNQSPPAKVKGYSYGSHHASNVARRIEGLYTALLDTYYRRQQGRNSRFVFVIGNDYYLTEYRDGTLAFEKAASLPDLARLLAAPRLEFSPVVFDTGVYRDFALPEVYRLNKPGIIQLFFYIENRKANLYIVDERGSLFTMVIPFYDGKSLINHFRIFFASITNRRNIFLTADGLPVEEVGTEFYYLHQEHGKNYTAKPIEVSDDPDQSSYFNIQVLGDLAENNQTNLTIYCEDFEFSTVEYGEHIFAAVANHVVKQRKGGATYPIYITDIDLSRSLFFESDVRRLQSVHYLEYKKRIEIRLNETMTAYISIA